MKKLKIKYEKKVYSLIERKKPIFPNHEEMSNKNLMN